MGSDSERECCDAVKHRLIPKLREKNSSNLKRKTNDVGTVTNGKKETSEERVQRISHTHVSFMEFWFQCLDWEMLKLFFALLMLFLCAVGFATLLYLFLVFFLKENLWYYYFPLGKREELWFEEAKWTGQLETPPCTVDRPESSGNQDFTSMMELLIGIWISCRD